MRSALKALEQESLVQSVKGAGYFVAKLSYQDLMEIDEMRIGYEALATRPFMKRCTTDERDALEELYLRQQELVERGDHAAALKSDFLFHKHIVYGSHNTRLINAYDVLSTQRSLMSFNMPISHEMDERSLKEHRRILDAIEAGDVTAAEAASIDHVQNIMNFHAQNYYQLG